MDWLKLEIDSKKRQLEQATDSTGELPSNKYLKRTDLDRHRLEDNKRLYGAAKQAAKLELESGTTLRPPSSSSTAVPTSPRHNASRSPRSATPDAAAAAAALVAGQKVEHSKPEAFNVSNDEAIRRLRQKGQPIRLFGETDKERRLRLRALELIEERTEGQRNDFMKAMEAMEKGAGSGLQEGDKDKSTAAAASAKAKGKQVALLNGTEGEAESETAIAEKQGKEPNPKDEEVIVDVSLVKTNPHKVYPQIYHALKRVLKEWEQSLADRPESVRRSTQGKMASATQQTSAEYLKPLFKALRKRELAPDVLLAVAEITFYMQTREYLKANDSYLRLSIGNAPWPIGVTMVGIHERAGRSRIFSDNIAHVLNDETSRKYIQSLKRLLTFAQTVRPPSDLSQLMG